MTRSTVAREAPDRRAAPHDDRARRLDALRREVGALEAAPENGAPDVEAAPWRFGLAGVDAALPDGGLARGALHEIAGDAYPDMTAALGFCLGLLRLLPPVTPARGTILWVRSRFARREFGALYGHGLSAFGLDPASLLFADTGGVKDALWAIEEGARAGCLKAVIGEAGAPAFKQTQRLSRAAAVSRTPVLLLIPPESGRKEPQASTAATRWRIARAPGSANTFDTRAPEGLRWHAMLTRCRGGRPKNWFMEWRSEAHCFDLAVGLSDRPAEDRGPAQAAG